MPPETRHMTFQKDFHAAIWQAEPPAGLTAPDPAEIGQRFKVYCNNVQHSLTRALAARFPVVEELVGTTFFTAMARVFIAASPPKDPVMLRWGDGFPAFLAGFPPVAHLPYLADVARLEYARGVACHAADADPVAAARLQESDLESLRIRLHPSVTLYRAPQPAVQIWMRHQPGAVRTPLAPGPDHALIARQPDFAVVVAPVDADTFAVLCALHSGETLGFAAAKADPTPALTLLLGHGLIVDIKKGPFR